MFYNLHLLERIYKYDHCMFDIAAGAGVRGVASSHDYHHPGLARVPGGGVIGSSLRLGCHDSLLLDGADLCGVSAFTCEISTTTPV